METMNILDLNELIEAVTTDENKETLAEIIQEFKREHYPNVLSKTKATVNQFPNEKNLKNLMDIIDAISHAEIGEYKASKEIIDRLYRELNSKETSELIRLAELAFMSDYRLSRRIMTDAIKVLENEEAPDLFMLTRCYLVLGEAEENLQKYKRAIKYYQKGLRYYKETEEMNDDSYMLKIGRASCREGG